MMKRFLLTLVLAIVLSVPAWAGFDEGRAAYDRGDYETALREWRPLAEQGDANMQAILGAMYSEGLGVAQDYAEALKWYRRAAKRRPDRGRRRVGPGSRKTPTWVDIGCSCAPWRVP